MANMFPQGYADGPAFCNRTTQRSNLIKLIEASRHGWIQGRRRIGKSSLLRQMIRDIERRRKKDIFAHHTELLPAYDQSVATKLILQAISDVTQRILGNSEKALKNILTTFAALKPEISITASGPRLKLAIDSKEGSIKDALLALDKVAQAKKVKVALFFDEFQQLGEIDKGVAIEAEIRGALQLTKATSFIFSGSIRHLLEQQFSDETRPLYKQCQRIELRRISAKDYTLHLKKISKLNWGLNIDEGIIKEIVQLTDRHPYYVNALCGLLWLNKAPPTIEQIHQTWQDDIVDSDFASYQRTLSKLSTNQNKVLSNLAITPTDQPLSAAFARACGISTSSVQQSVEKLILHDHVYRDDDGVLRLFDPAIAAYLKRSLPA